MKFTKEQAIEKIKASYASRGEKTNLERTIKEHVESLCAVIGEDSEMELDEFVTKATPFVETALGLSRKVGSDAVTAYKEQHPEKKDETKPEEKKEETPSELEKRLLALEEKLRESEQKNKIEGKKAELLAAMKSKGIKDDEWSSEFISQISITEDMNVDEKADAYLKIYNKSKSRYGNYSPHKPGSSEESEHEDLSDVAELIKQRDPSRAEVK